MQKKRVNGRPGGVASAGTSGERRIIEKKEGEEKEEDRLVADRTIDLWRLYEKGDRIERERKRWYRELLNGVPLRDTYG